MKKILLTFLFFTTFSNAQIVNIPDANLKSKLLMSSTFYNIAKDQLGNNIAIDANHDGQIQQDEALAVYELNLSIFGTPFTDMTGLLSFANLKTLSVASNHITNFNLAGLDLENLDCGFCYFTSLDLTPFPHLKHLSCGSNSISSLNLSAVPLLETLTCRYNNLSSLNIQYTPNLNFLDCQYNHIQTLNTAATPNITFLLCDSNNLSSIDLSNMPNLQTLGCGSNPITALDLSHVPNMEDLSFSYCSVNSVDLSLMPNLGSLVCPFNPITSLDLSHSPNLGNLWCYNCLLTNLNLDSNPHLNGLNCNNNQIAHIQFNNPHPELLNIDFSYNLMTDFNFSNAPALTYIKCNNNQLTTLDFSAMLGLNQFDCSSNNLSQILIKNGRVESQVNFSNNPNLSFICVDDQQVVSIQNQLNTLGMNSTVCNTYCSFIMGGNHNTISGKATFDYDNNGCDINDFVFPLMKFKINYGLLTDLGASATNTLGIYTFYTMYGDNYIIPDVENSSFFNFSPVNAHVVFPNSNNNSATADFCITANGIHPDVEVVIIPVTPARPGFVAHYKIVYRNKGNQMVSGSVDFTYDDSLLDSLNASVIPSSQNNGTITWNYTNLMPFENRSIDVFFQVNSPAQVPPASIGTVLNFLAIVNPVVNDEIPSDNYFDFEQFIIGSYDPNDKVCLEGNNVSPVKIGDYLHYTINFENTGTAPAEFVVVKDIIDTADFDMGSLQVMNSSHPLTTKVSENQIEFIFENINLGSGEHGNVTFKIKTKSNLVTGNTVSNTADIYFDYNAPVTTNTASTTFQTLGIDSNEIDSSINIYPNPAMSTINVSSQNEIGTIQLYDVNGRVLMVKVCNELHSIISVSDFAKGIYFLKVNTEKGMKTEKIIKE